MKSRLKADHPTFHRRFFDRMDGFEFEQYCAKLLEKNGFHHVTITELSGDQGIDIIATKRSVTYGIQCKNYNHTVGNKAVQEAYAGCCYYDLDQGVVLTNNYFSKSAKELAEETDILLWDRDELLRLKRHHRFGGIFSGMLLSFLIIVLLFFLIYQGQKLF